MAGKAFRTGAASHNQLLEPARRQALGLRMRRRDPVLAITDGRQCLQA